MAEHALDPALSTLAGGTDHQSAAPTIASASAEPEPAPTGRPRRAAAVRAATRVAAVEETNDSDFELSADEDGAGEEEADEDSEEPTPELGGADEDDSASDDYAPSRTPSPAAESRRRRRAPQPSVVAASPALPTPSVFAVPLLPASKPAPPHRRAQSQPGAIAPAAAPRHIRSPSDGTPAADYVKQPQSNMIYACHGFHPCAKTFSRQEHLARHMRRHTGEKPFTCHCGRKFSRLDNLRQHTHTVHADDPEQNLAALERANEVHAGLSQAMGVQPRGPSSSTHRRRAPSTPGSATSSKRAKSSASPPHQQLPHPTGMPSVMSATAPHPSMHPGPYPPGPWQMMHGGGEPGGEGGHPPPPLPQQFHHRPPPLELAAPWNGGPPTSAYFGEPIGPYGPAQHGGGGPADWDRRPSLPPIASMYAQPGQPVSLMTQPSPPPTGYAPYPYQHHYGYAPYMPAPPQHPQYVGYSNSPPNSAYGLPPNSPTRMWYSGMSAVDASAANGGPPPGLPPPPPPHHAYTGTSVAGPSVVPPAPSAMAFTAPTAATHIHPSAPAAPAVRTQTISPPHPIAPPRASSSPSAPTSFAGSPHELDPTHGPGPGPGPADPSYHLAPVPPGVVGGDGPDKRHSLGELCADDATPRMAADPATWQHVIRTANGTEALGLAPVPETRSY